MNKPKADLVIWDWNGTLQDDARAAWESVNDMLRRRDMPLITFEQYSSYIETPIIGFYRHIFDLSVVSFEQLAKEFHEGYAVHMQGRGLVENAVPVLEKLRDAGVRQVIVSSGEKNWIMSYARSYGILGFFDAVLGADDLEAGSKVERAAAYMKQCGADPRRTLVVGDLLHDAEMAAAIGAECLLVAAGHQIREHLEPAGVPVADDITGVVEAVL